MKISGLCLLLLTVSLGVQAQTSEEQLKEKARKIHEDVITIDTHDDINVANFTAEKNYTQDLDTQITLPKMKKGGLDVAWLVVYTGQGELNAAGYKKAYENAISKFDAIHRLADEYAPNQVELATNSQDVRDAISSGKMAVMIGVENGYAIGTDIKNVEKFYDRGARYMSLAHQGHSQLSDSNTGEEDGKWLHNGLSKLGREVIKEMNRLGMMIDISHPSKEAIRQMIELSKAPVIASHSSARQLGHHSRNLDDEMLQWVKDNGGVVQTVAFRSYVNTEKQADYEKAVEDVYRQVGEKVDFKIISRDSIRSMDEQAQTAYFKKYREVRKLSKPRVVKLHEEVPPVDVSDFVDHIDYMVEKIGIEHVGISSDFDGGGGVEGWNDASETFNITLELVKRGYTAEEIKMLWGENLLRVLDEVEAVAQKIQKG
ncbi:dipeptidase [Salinimicrobium sp. GXAS 041]|uniref:dipeptidase n=1 Tax=Salinimicrobium sp. GXAS 041 TaxID=3400806 RepID=UPI003C793CD6